MIQKMATDPLMHVIGKALHGTLPTSTASSPVAAAQTGACVLQEPTWSPMMLWLEKRRPLMGARYVCCVARGHVMEPLDCLPKRVVPLLAWKETVTNPQEKAHWFFYQLVPCAVLCF